jgi:2-phospho-L-lactate guanylyltransferase
MIAAAVPVKALPGAKSRFVPGERAAIERLTLAMLADVLEALRAVPALGRVAVVTPDPAVARAAEAEGAEVLLRDDPGLNPAVEAASALLAPGPEDGILIVLGDVAAADPAELTRLIEEAPARGVALAPSRDGGTSALLRRPRDVIPACFGPDSAKRHREAAAAAGVALCELALPSLAIDVDVVPDARAILELPSLGRRTRAAIADLGVPAAP